MKSNMLFLGIFATFLFACNNSETTVRNPLTGKKDSIVIDHQVQSPDKLGVKLDGGRKWPANLETTQGIRKMRKIMNRVSAESGIEDYHLLQPDLKKEFDAILQKCTMNGEAHNQLHNYLVPMQDMVKNLGADSIEECRQAADALKQHLDQYTDFFQ